MNNKKNKFLIKMKFHSDDELSLNKTIESSITTIVVKVIF